MIFEKLRIGGHVLYKEKVYRVRAIDEDKEEVYVDGLEEPLPQFSDIPLSHDILTLAKFTPKMGKEVYIKDIGCNTTITLKDNGFSKTLFIDINPLNEHFKAYVYSLGQLENILLFLLNYELIPTDKFSRSEEYYDNSKLPF